MAPWATAFIDCRKDRHWFMVLPSYFQVIHLEAVVVGRRFWLEYFFLFFSEKSSLRSKLIITPQMPRYKDANCVRLCSFIPDSCDCTLWLSQIKSRDKLHHQHIILCIIYNHLENLWNYLATRLGLSTPRFIISGLSSAAGWIRMRKRNRQRRIFVEEREWDIFIGTQVGIRFTPQRFNKTCSVSSYSLLYFEYWL